MVKIGTNDKSQNNNITHFYKVFKVSKIAVKITSVEVVDVMTITNV
jgi:hypothetical protein